MRRSPEQLEAQLGRILTAGVMLAGAIVTLGGAIYLLRHGGEQVRYHVFTGEPSDLKTIGGAVGDAMRLSGRAIIQFGLIVLVAMQVLRVVFTVWLFKVARDRVFLYISLLILAVLAYSLFGHG